MHGARRATRRPEDADAVPARFLLACRAGHLDDFPWHWFVHGGPSACKGTLRFFESGASLQTENLWVKCDSCGAAKNMAQAFGQSGKDNLPGCRGRHPHLDSFERRVRRGAARDPARRDEWLVPGHACRCSPSRRRGARSSQLVADGWTFFEDVESEPEVGFVVKTLKKTAQLPGIDAFTRRSDLGGDRSVPLVARPRWTQSDLKGPEWDVLTADEPPTDYPHFMSTKEAAPQGFEDVGYGHAAAGTAA